MSIKQKPIEYRPSLRGKLSILLLNLGLSVPGKAIMGLLAGLFGSL